VIVGFSVTFCAKEFATGKIKKNIKDLTLFIVDFNYIPEE
jgi:hypothetical protein